jgi:hypothetical protein
MRDFIRKNRWSMLSTFITVGSATLIFALVRYLYWRGLWGPSASARGVLSVWGALSLTLSLISAIVGLVKDASKASCILALFLSLFSFLLYVQ